MVLGGLTIAIAGCFLSNYKGLSTAVVLGAQAIEIAGCFLFLSTCKGGLSTTLRTKLLLKHH